MLGVVSSTLIEVLGQSQSISILYLICRLDGMLLWYYYNQNYDAITGVKARNSINANIYRDKYNAGWSISVAYPDQ